PTSCSWGSTSTESRSRATGPCLSRRTVRTSATSTMRSSRRGVMRWLCWCSAVLVLSACAHHVRATPGPFAYDRSAPLAIIDGGVFASGARGTIRKLTFAGVDGSRVPAYLVVPRRAGRYPAVLFLHGSGGSRLDFVVEAARLGLEGAVTMTISQPNDAQTYRPLVVNALRALDL